MKTRDAFVLLHLYSCRLPKSSLFCMSASCPTTWYLCCWFFTWDFCCFDTERLHSDCSFHRTPLLCSRRLELEQGEPFLCLSANPIHSSFCSPLPFLSVENNLFLSRLQWIYLNFYCHGPRWTDACLSQGRGRLVGSQAGWEIDTCTDDPPAGMSQNCT